jgi:rod shape-determining protein MreB
VALIRRRPSRRLVYVQLSAERILLRRVATGATVDEVPQVALGPDGVPVAFGHAAEEAARWRRDLRIVNGFSHPRTLIGEMEVAAATLMYFLRRLLDPREKRWRRIRPDLVLHPVDVEDLSGLEAWGLQEIARIAGARSVRVWLGEEPPYETLTGGAPSGGSWRLLAPPAKRKRR